VLIAKRIGISESTLRGYWESYGGQVPDANAKRLAELIQEIAPVPLSKEAGLNLLRGSQLALHSVLLPIEGKSWRALLNEQLELEIGLRPPRGLLFGEVDEEDRRVADETVALNKNFRFGGRMPWEGEGFLAAEHEGVWHLINLSENERSFAFEEGEFYLPLPKGEEKRYMIERHKPGFYSYFVIGHKESFSDDVRHKLRGTNPYSQLDLDLLGSMILQTNPADRIVLAATLRVRSDTAEE
jgi:hypothetical protein